MSRVDKKESNIIRWVVRLIYQYDWVGEKNTPCGVVVVGVKVYLIWGQRGDGI